MSMVQTPHGQTMHGDPHEQALIMQAVMAALRTFFRPSLPGAAALTSAELMALRSSGSVLNAPR